MPPAVLCAAALKIALSSCPQPSYSNVDIYWDVWCPREKPRLIWTDVPSISEYLRDSKI